MTALPASPFIFVGDATPSEKATTVYQPPITPAVVANNSDSAVEPAAMLSAGLGAGPCFTDPTVPASTNSVSLVGSLSSETAATDHSFTGSGFVAAATIPDVPEFLRRDRETNIAPFHFPPVRYPNQTMAPNIAAANPTTPNAVHNSQSMGRS